MYKFVSTIDINADNWFFFITSLGISDIPESIKSCKRLSNVNASTNPLCRLPEGFTQLIALKELCLSDTFLVSDTPGNFRVNFFLCDRIKFINLLFGPV